MPPHASKFTHMRGRGGVRGCRVVIGAVFGEEAENVYMWSPNAKPSLLSREMPCHPDTCVTLAVRDGDTEAPLPPRVSMTAPV